MAILLTQTPFTTGSTTTTNNTITTCETVTLASNTSYVIKTRVVGKRTGGSGGSSGDTIGAEIMSTYKNVSGTVTLIGTDHTIIDTSNTNCSVGLVISGATVLVQVTGDTNNNYSWNSQTLTLPQG
jgi:hypothetical protein